MGMTASTNWNTFHVTVGADLLFKGGDFTQTDVRQAT